MEMNRRALVRSSALAPVALGVSGMASGALFTCSPTGGVQIDPAVLDAIMKAVAEGCNFIPAVETIVGLVSATFPAVVGATTIAASVLSEISDILCANVPTPASPVSSLKLKKPVGATLPVASHGWVIQSGKLVYI